MKSVQVEPSFVPSDRQTDRHDKLIATFRNFANAIKNQNTINRFYKLPPFNTVHKVTPRYVDPGRWGFVVHISSSLGLILSPAFSNLMSLISVSLVPTIEL